MTLSADENWVGTWKVESSNGAYKEVARHLVVRGVGGKTFVVLHGYAGGAMQTRGFFQDWVDAADGASFLFLEGVMPCAGMGGFGWLPLTSDQTTLANCLQELTPRVEQYIVGAIADEGLGHELVLVGHSQGAMLALEIVARAKIQVEGVIAISGMYPVPARMSSADSCARSEHPEVIFIHEDADPMIPLRRALESEQAFNKRGFRTKMFVVEGGQHVLSRVYASQVRAVMSPEGNAMGA